VGDPIVASTETSALSILSGRYGESLKTGQGQKHSLRNGRVRPLVVSYLRPVVFCKPDVRWASNPKGSQGATLPCIAELLRVRDAFQKRRALFGLFAA